MIRFEMTKSEMTNDEARNDNNLTFVMNPLVMSSEVETSLDFPAAEIARHLIRSLPVRSASGLPVYVAASPAAPFSTALRSARNDNGLEDAFELRHSFVIRHSSFVIS
jgi:hypothetical protein